MKLKELFEKIDLSKSTPVDLQGQQWLPISGDKVGGGIQARVYGAGQGMVTKIAILDDDMGINDPAVKFLDIILDHQDNPFFPKIYHARVYRDKEGIRDPILIVQMEKLLPIIDDKIADAVSHLFQQLGLPIEGDWPQRNRGALEPNQERVIGQADEFHHTIRALSPEEMDEFASKSKNPKFKEAMSILMPAIKKYGSDLHYGNWMVRLTSTGPQLVIIDPFVASTAANLY